MNTKIPLPRATPTPLYDALINMGTLMYARIHMGIPPTLHDVSKH